MKKLSRSITCIIFTSMLIYSASVDFILIEHHDYISLYLSKSDVQFLAMMLGMTMFYSFIAISYKINFIKLLRGKAYPDSKLPWQGYQLIFFVFIYFLLFSGRIPYMTIPFMLAVIIDLINLFYFRSLSASNKHSEHVPR